MGEKEGVRKAVEMEKGRSLWLLRLIELVWFYQLTEKGDMRQLC